jgi:hypothetical protein
VIARDDGMPDLRALRSKRRGHEAVLFAFDLIEHDGDDLRDLPLIERKRRLSKLLGRAQRRAIRYNEHLNGRRPDRVRPCLQDGVGGRRVEAGGCSVPERAIEDVAQVEEPGERGGAPGARGGVALSKVQSVDQPMRLGMRCGFRQLRTCRRTRPGSYVP